MRPEEFTPLFEALCATANREPTEALSEAYWLGCSDLSTDSWRTAVMRSIREGDGRMPSPRALRELGGEMSPENRAIAAWATVRKTVRLHGAYRSIDFEDPAINAAIRSMGGWVALCSKPTDEFDTWARKEFERQYRSWSEMPGTEMARRLVGVAEAENGGRFEAEVITVPTIGDGSRADIRRIEARSGGDRQSLGSALINSSVEAMMRGLAQNQGDEE